METPNYKEYLSQWINKAVQKGGFTAQEASDALIALSQLKDPKEVEQLIAESQKKPSRGGK